MITGRPAATYGKQRTCPHCKATILASATVCPACKHHLQFVPGADKRATAVPLKVEGSVRHPPSGEPWEYSVVVAIRNERGEEVARHVVGVGALQPSEARTFSLAVEVFGGADSMADASIATEPPEAPAPVKIAEIATPKAVPDSRPYKPAVANTTLGSRAVQLPPLNPPGLRPSGTPTQKPSGPPPRK